MQPQDAPWKQRLEHNALVARIQQSLHPRVQRLGASRRYHRFLVRVVPHTVLPLVERRDRTPQRRQTTDARVLVERHGLHRHGRAVNARARDGEVRAPLPETDDPWRLRQPSHLGEDGRVALRLLPSKKIANLSSFRRFSASSISKQPELEGWQGSDTLMIQSSKCSSLTSESNSICTKIHFC